MKVKVSKIDPNKGETLEGSLDAADVDAVIHTFEGHRALGDLSYRLELHRTGRRVLLRGTLAGEVEASCRRCLKPVRYEFEVEGHGSFTPPPSEAYAEELELSESDLDDEHYKDDELDLTPWIGETVLLELNPYVLCRDDCPGFCPHCGIDLNERSCECAAQVIDPRWEGLLALKRKK